MAGNLTACSLVICDAKAFWQYLLLYLSKKTDPSYMVAYEDEIARRFPVDRQTHYQSLLRRRIANAVLLAVNEKAAPVDTIVDACSHVPKSVVTAKLVKGLGRGEAEMVARKLTLLGKLGNGKTVSVCGRMLRHKNEIVRLAAVESLREIASRGNFSSTDKLGDDPKRWAQWVQKND